MTDSNQTPPKTTAPAEEEAPALPVYKVLVNRMPYQQPVLLLHGLSTMVPPRGRTGLILEKHIPAQLPNGVYQTDDTQS